MEFCVDLLVSCLFNVDLCCCLEVFCCGCLLGFVVLYGWSLLLLTLCVGSFIALRIFCFWRDFGVLDVFGLCFSGLVMFV